MSLKIIDASLKINELVAAYFVKSLLIKARNPEKGFGE